MKTLNETTLSYTFELWEVRYFSRVINGVVEGSDAGHTGYFIRKVKTDKCTYYCDTVSTAISDFHKGNMGAIFRKKNEPDLVQKIAEFSSYEELKEKFPEWVV